MSYDGAHTAFTFFYWWGGTKSLGTVATSGLLCKPQMIDEDDCGAIGGMKIGRGNWSTRRKPAPAPLCPQQIPHDQTHTAFTYSSCYFQQQSNDKQQKDMTWFTNVEYANMSFVCGLCDVNATAASKEYQHQYPDKMQSNRHFTLMKGSVFTPPALVDCSRHNVQTWQILYMIIHWLVLTGHILDRPFRVQFGVYVQCMKSSCILFI
jgi:hypothetical protein